MKFHYLLIFYGLSFLACLIVLLLAYARGIARARRNDEWKPSGPHWPDDADRIDRPKGD
jgi:hypothetical protein